MKKYFIFIFVLMLSVALAADEPFDPADNLDKPMEEVDLAGKFLLEMGASGTTGGDDAWWYAGSDANLFDNQAAYNILNSIYNITQWDFSHSYDLWGRKWTKGDYNQFRNDVKYFLDRFPASSEVFTMSMSQGDSAYFDEYGQEMSPDPDQYYEDFDVKKTHRLEFYAGRNTAVAGEWTTDTNKIKSDSSRYHQFSLTTKGRKYEIYAYGAVTPIVLDMDGDRKLQASNGKWLFHDLAKDCKLVEFDINGDGFNELVEWAGPNDGILLVYDGGEVNGKNFFGSAEGFRNGYEKLSGFDSNNDKELTGSELNKLSVWQDKNGNAKVDSGEISSVMELGISKIKINHKLLVSEFVQNGQSKLMWDWNPATLMIKRKK